MKGKHLHWFVLGFLGLALCGAPSYLNAQTDPDTPVDDETTTDATTTVDGDVEADGELEGDIYDPGSLTESDIEILLEESDDVTEEEVADDPLLGTVIAVEGDEVLIRTLDGEVVSVSAGAALTAFNATGEVSLDDVVPGMAIVLSEEGSTRDTGSVVTVENGMVVVTTTEGEQRFTATGATVTRNGERVTLADVREGDDVTVLMGPNGEVLSISAEGDDSLATSTDDEADGWPWWVWVILVGVAGGLLWKLLSSQRRM